MTQKTEIKFSSLSVTEILHLADSNQELCEELNKYIKYGKDLTKAYAVMMKIPGHRLALIKLLGLDRISPEMVAAVKPFTKGLDDDAIYRTLNSAFYNENVKRSEAKLTLSNMKATLLAMCQENAPNDVKIVA